MTLEEIKQKITEYEKKDDVDFIVRVKSFESASKLVKEQNYSTVSVKEFDRAKQAIEEFFAKKEAEANQEIRFDNILSVVDYLKAQGWKIEKSKAYTDRILMKPQKDGSFLQKDIDKYAQGFLQKADGSDFNGSMEEKLKWETEIAKQKAEQLTRRNEVEEGMYILRSDVEQMLSGRASLLKSEMEAFFYNFMPRICETLEGNVDKIPDAITFSLSEKEKWFNRYAEKIEFMAPVIIGGEDAA